MHLKSAVALGHMRDPVAKDALIGILSDDDPEIRKQSVLSLEYIGANDIVPELINFFHDQDHFVRWYAVESTIKLGCDSSLVKSLTSLKDDPVWIVRKVTKEALEKIGTPKALDALP